MSNKRNERTTTKSLKSDTDLNFIEDIVRIWKDNPCSWIDRVNIGKMAIQINTLI